MYLKLNNKNNKIIFFLIFFFLIFFFKVFLLEIKKSKVKLTKLHKFKDITYIFFKRKLEIDKIIQ